MRHITKKGIFILVGGAIVALVVPTAVILAQVVPVTGSSDPAWLACMAAAIAVATAAAYALWWCPPCAMAAMLLVPVVALSMCGPAPTPPPPPPPPPPPVLAPICSSFTASPTTLTGAGTVTLSWTTANAASVTLTPGGYVAANGSQAVAVTSTTNFVLTAANSIGQQCSKGVTVTVQPPPPPNPTATLFRCNATTDPQGCSNGSSGWSSGNMTIVTGQQIKLRWTSSETTTSCSGSNFTTHGNRNSQVNADPNVVPTSGDPVTYTLTCNDNIPSTPDAVSQVTVTANDVAPELSASKTTVRTNEPFTLTWNLNGNVPTQCTITGPDSTLTTPGSITAQSDDITIEAVGSATYTLKCPGGEDSVNITMLPQVYES